jgi:formamidopyrimidine-DNA glycosylase
MCARRCTAPNSPLRAAGSLKPRETTRLAAAIGDVLSAAIEVGGSTLRDHRQTDGTLDYFQHRFAVYDRGGAAHARCGGIISRAVQSGRSTFDCGVSDLISGI